MERVRIDPAAPDAAAVQRVGHMLRRGALAIIPTDTLYGLAANPFDPTVVERIFTVKRRDPGQALPLIAASRRQVEEMLGTLGPRASRLAERYWPGPLTLVVPRPDTLGLVVSGGGPRVGVRVPDHPVARALCEASGVLLTATSANISGQPPSSDPDEVWTSVPPGIDLLIDAGATPGGAPSTIADVTDETPVLIRAGAIAWEEVLACLAHG